MVPKYLSFSEKKVQRTSETRKPMAMYRRGLGAQKKFLTKNSLKPFLKPIATNMLIVPVLNKQAIFAGASGRIGRKKNEMTIKMDPILTAATKSLYPVPWYSF